MKVASMADGEVYKTSNFGQLKVLKYIDACNVVVQFVDTGFKTTARASSIRNGEVKDRMSPSKYGVGYIGVGTNYTSKSRAYGIWCNMIRRCYSPKSLEMHPTYRGCSVDKDWHNFQVFAEWYGQNYKDGYQLDKDLLVVGNKVYSEDTCVFVTPKINLFITDSAAKRGCCPIGVSYHRRSNKYVACCNSGGGRQKHLGHFTCPDLAHLKWKGYKLSLALEMKPEMDIIDKRIYHNVVTILNNTK